MSKNVETKTTYVKDGLKVEVFQTESTDWVQCTRIKTLSTGEVQSVMVEFNSIDELRSTCKLILSLLDAH